MICITDDLFLTDVKFEHLTQLQNLMDSIYRRAYAHLWKDKGRSYLDAIYAKRQVCEDLSKRNSRYYFVHYHNEKIGILKLLLDVDIHNNPSDDGVMLHRIYLDKKVQGMGLGKELLSWVENTYCKNGTKLWLEVMDTQKQALKFYKNLGFTVVETLKFDSNLIYTKYKGMYKMVKEF